VTAGLCDKEPAIVLAYELAQEFVTMARERTGEGFDAWLTRATTSGITELDRFARGLTGDRGGVEAALSLEWSNGQTEGQVNKLKLLKRSMYGRANFDLLRLRLLNAARCACAAPTRLFPYQPAKYQERNSNAVIVARMVVVACKVLVRPWIMRPGNWTRRTT